jgi:Skp family chaperone for outer membrane proteins
MWLKLSSKGEEITVTFDEDVGTDAVKDAAEGLIEALRLIVDGTSTLNVKGQTFTLSDVTASQLALAILDGQSAAGFLEAGEPIVAAYTASVDYKNTTIALSGEVSFEVVGTKAVLLEKLDTEFKKIDVAEVVLDKATEEITVTFDEDVGTDAVKDAAEGLIEALRLIVDGTSTLNVKGQTFTLSDVTASQLALAILDGQSAAGFLEAGEPIVAAYTASVDYKNTTIALSGEVSFEVVGTKAVLLEKLDTEFKKIDVAEVVLDKATEEITVTFDEDVGTDAVKDAAEGLIEALRLIVDGTSTLNVKGQTFTLSDVTASQLALAILDGQSAAGFLEAGEPIVAAYTASVDYKNTTIALSGEVSFEVVGTKAVLLEKLDTEFKKIDVADVVLDKATEEITVTFDEDVGTDAVKDAAEGLIEALRLIVDGTSTLNVKGQTFTLSDVTASQLALAILDGQSAAGFLEAGEPIVAAYTASVDYKNTTIALSGEVSFEVVGTKAVLLEKLDTEFKKIDVAEVVLLDKARRSPSPLMKMWALTRSRTLRRVSLRP